MSHPIPGHDYNEELPNRMKPKRLTRTQNSMKKMLGEAGKNKNENDFMYLKRMLKGKALEKKKGSPKGKTQNWPKHKPGYDWFKDNGNGGKGGLPPGYKQSDLE